MSNRNLIISPVGDGSLHPEWLQPSAARRQFDLMLIYYGDKAGQFQDQCEYYVARKGSKMELLAGVMEENRDLLSKYDAVWLPDDDIRTNSTTISRMFDLFHEEKLAIAQPALSRDSYYSHQITLKRRLLTLRYTTFVEMMVPLFRRDVLLELLPTFRANRSGWGIDDWWCHEARANGWGRIAIIDGVAVTHTRPINPGGGYYKAQGIDPRQEHEELLQRVGLKRECRMVGMRLGGFRLKWAR